MINIPSPLLVRKLLSDYRNHLTTLNRDFNFDLKETKYNSALVKRQKTRYDAYNRTILEIDNIIKKIDETT